MPPRGWLPRPPAVFVGRQRDLDHLRALRARSPVSVVAGWPGVGKTTLVAAALLETERACVSRAGSASDAVADLLRQLDVDAGDPPSSDVEKLVDVAVSAERCVVLDAVDRWPSGDVAALLRSFAQAAHGGAELIVTSRERPDVPDLAEQVLWLAPLAAEDAEALVEACAPTLPRDEARQIARASAGIPRDARWLAHSAVSPGGPFDDLDHEARALVAVLVAVDDAIPIDVIPASARRHVARLLARGIAERHRDEIRITDLGRTGAERHPPRPDSAWLRAVAEGLRDGGDPLRRLDAIRAIRAIGDDAEIDAWLAPEGEGFVAAVGAERLDEVLRGLGSRHALRLRAECAHRSPSAERLAWVAVTTPPDDPASWLAFGRARFSAQDLAGAIEAFDRVVTSGGDAATRLRALLWKARCVPSSRLADLLEHLEREDAPSADLELDRSLALAVACARLGDEARATRHARRVHGSWHLFPSRRAAAVRSVLDCYIQLSLYRDAIALADEEGLGEPRDAKAIYPLAVLAVETCRADRGAWRRRLEAAAGSARFAFFAAYLAFRDRLLVDPSDAASAAREMRRRADALGDPDFDAWTDHAELAVSLLLGHAESAPVLAERPGIGPRLARQRAAHEALRQLRAEGNSPLAPPEAGEHRIATVHRALQRMLAGDGDATVDLARRIDLARGHTRVLELAELLVAWGEALLGERAPSNEVVVAVTRELRGLAENHGLTLAGLAADELDVVLGNGGRDPGAIERLAAAGDAPPARRARARLGRTARLDAVDRHILRVRNVASPRLVLDEHARTLCDAAGHTASFGAQKTLFDLVARLHRAGTGATKEELARDVWGLRAYVPSRDDKRLHVAVNRARSLLRSQGCDATIRTTPTGYALAPPEGDVSDP